MSSGIEGIDRSLQQTNLWLKDLMTRLGTEIDSSPVWRCA